MRLFCVSEDLKAKLREIRISFEWKSIMDEAKKMENDGVFVDRDQLYGIVEVLKNDSG